MAVGRVKISKGVANFVYKAIALWIVRKKDNPAESTKYEISSIMTRDKVDEWFAVNGITYGDYFRLSIGPNYVRRGQNSPDRYLTIHRLTEKDMVQGQYVEATES